MRKTRDNNWQIVLFLVPAVAVGFGIHYLIKKSKSQTVVATTSSPATADSADKALGYRSLASDGDADDKRPAKTVAMNSAKAGGDEDEDAPDRDLRSPAGEKTYSKKELAELNEKDKNDNTCTSFELRGDGPTETHVSNEEWAQVMGLFHESKASLQSWLTAHNSEFPGGLVKWMSEQVENSRIQRPPVAEEPDLNWRGIGVIAHVGNGTETVPLVRVGGGFIKMAVAEPKRARFELTRLIAQSWNPCDLPTGAHQTWEPLLKCIGMKDQDWDYKKSCAIGSTSESGWAVASAIAVTASPPGCVLPAFQTLSANQCVKKTAWLSEPPNGNSRMPASVLSLQVTGTEEKKNEEHKQ